MHTSASPTERIGVCHDAKQQIFNKVSDMRQCGIDERHTLSPQEEVNADIDLWGCDFTPASQHQCA